MVVAEPNKSRARAANATMDLSEDVAVMATGDTRMVVARREEGLLSVRAGHTL